jgi:hypothetical protein
MSSRWLPVALSAAFVLLGVSPSLAAAQKVKAASPQASAPNAGLKLVDINHASRAELKQLPGIGEAEADRIIAARPYPSKAKLVAEKVLPYESYLIVKGRIIATQPSQAPKRKP